MKLLIMDLNETFSEYLINKYISQGIEIYSAKKPNEAFNLIKNKGITHIIINIESRFYDYTTFIDELKKQDAKHQLYIIAQTRRLYKENVASLLERGVSGILPLTGDLDETYEKVKNLVKEQGYIPNRRQYFRMSFQENEKPFIKFPIPNFDKMVTGRINDLSIYAIAFELDNPEETSFIRENEVLDNVQLILEEKRAFTEVVITKMREKIIVARFVKPQKNENFMSFLCHFIYRHLHGTQSSPFLVDH